MVDHPASVRQRALLWRLASWAIALAGALLATPASAAQISVDRGGDTATVTVRGTLETEDGQRFADVVASLTKAIVMLNSPGGDLDSGLSIGRTIRRKSFSTGVPNGVRCASACALAWLGGTSRYMGASARVGFHAAYVDGKGGPRESGVGNALVGAYLNGLGLPEEAVIYMTSPAPDDIQWMTMDAARKMGISVAVLQGRPGPPDRSDPPLRSDPAPRPGRPPVGAPPAITQIEPGAKPIRPSGAPSKPTSFTASRQQAVEFIGEYFDHWSDRDSRAMDYVTGLYADTVDFYGKQASPRIIIDANQKFIERWPIRVYTVRPASLQVECDSNSANCVIKGLVDWECLNPRQGARSVGLSDFVIGATFSPSGDVMVYREAGKVISKSE